MKRFTLEIIDETLYSCFTHSLRAIEKKVKIEGVLAIDCNGGRLFFLGRPTLCFLLPGGAEPGRFLLTPGYG